jgi:DNA-binding MarR family transcriptional regulator
MLAISNIYRAANAVRNRMEREVLGPAGLTWGGFTILFVLWIWGDRETGDLAEDCGLAKGTLTGMVKTLERQGLVRRARHPRDGRRVVVHLEEPGTGKIESIFPEFNRHEALFTGNLDREERRHLSQLLRVVVATTNGEALLPDLD